MLRVSQLKPDTVALYPHKKLLPEDLKFVAYVSAREIWPDAQRWSHIGYPPR